MKRRTIDKKLSKRSIRTLNFSSDENFFRLSKSLKPQIKRTSKSSIKGKSTALKPIIKQTQKKATKTRNKTHLKSQPKSKNQIISEKSRDFIKKVDFNSAKSDLNQVVSNDFFEFLSIGFKFYLLSKNFTNLFVKHLIYFLTSPFYNLEFFLASMCGFIRSLYLLFVFLASCSLNLDKETKKQLYLYNSLSFGIESCLLASLGSIQMVYRMSVWDYKRKIVSDVIYRLEFVRFCFEVFLSIVFFVYFLLKYKNMKLLDFYRFLLNFH